MLINDNCKLEDREFRKRLQETSKDKDNQKYCCNNNYNNVEVCSFDEFKEKYIKINGIKSVDALCRDQNDDKIFLIEFKNGKVNRHQVLQKVYDSIIILSKRLDRPVNYFAGNYTFVLVYNQDKLSSNAKCRSNWLKTASDKTKDKRFEIRFGLEQLKGYLCKEVVTISKKEFNRL